jgi:hypothetical protein
MNFQKSSKDIKHFIGKFLDDRDILNYCMIDNNQHGNVCNEDFFYNVLLSRYPDTLKYRNTSFKKWYLSVIHYVDLLKRKYNFNYRQYNHGNPREQYKIFEELKNEKNPTLLLRPAATQGDLALVKFAVENGGDIHANEGALQWASENGHLDIVEYLVDKKANIHAWDEAALQFASLNGHLEIVKYLVEHGANIHAYDDIALRWARKNKHWDVVKYLESLP